MYLILDLKCPDIFYVSYTTDCMSVRWRNHKSHIKSNIKSCESAHHFIQLSDTTHKLDKSTQSVYTEQLSKHLAIILIAHIPPDPNKDIQSSLKQRENFWQGALKSTPLFDGINKRTKVVYISPLIHNLNFKRPKIEGFLWNIFKIKRILF